MENSKLMTPLFYGGNFNREGHRMRAVFEREITDGTTAYRMWRGAGKPNVTYPQAGNDRYLLHVEINGYLLPLGMTDYNLAGRCGFEPAAEELYGGKKNRGKWINALQESGGNDAVSAAVAEEQAKTEQYGSDPARQTGYIRSMLDNRVKTYLESKENGGQSLPDFQGALVLNDLARCQELSTIYKALRQEKEAAHRARAETEEKAYCAERNREAEQVVAEAIQIVRNDGVLENSTVTFYQSRYSSSTCSIFNYLMRQYQVDVPLRTQGWINKSLLKAIIKDGKCERLQYLRSKGGRGSQKFFECMNDLIRAVKAQAPEQAA